ncbi:MAG: hypothetical protein IJ197_04635 [Bacteroidaceae bacterium]|nr:hypothetical protein [Bacteroidaceae bacterium]
MKDFLKNKLFPVLILILTIVLVIVVKSETTDSDGDGPEVPAPTAYTVVIDGVSKPILSAGIEKRELKRDLYIIWLSLSKDKNEYVKIVAKANVHDGKTIDLTQKGRKNGGWWIWGVEYQNADRKRVFSVYAEPGTSHPVFQQGTLYVKRKGSDTAEFEIRLKDGKVKAEDPSGDGQEHTISLYFNDTLDFLDF